MNTSKTQPTITSKYHIEVPTNDHMSPPSVYKVWFGKSYFIWKGKSLLQSATWLAESIERYLRNDKNDTDSYLYFVCAHIRKTRCIKATIEVVDSDLIREGTAHSIDVYRMLKVEQSLLDEATAHEDKKCLNNNFQAHIPKWMEQEAPADVVKFRRTWKKR